MKTILQMLQISLAVTLSSLLFSASASGAAARDLTLGEEKMLAGEKLSQSGDLDGAVGAYRLAATDFENEKAAGRRIDALIHLAGVYQQLGQLKLAANTLHEALDLAEALKDQGRQIHIQTTIGSIEVSARQLDFAETDLRAALKLARQERDPETIAAVLNELGNLFTVQEDYSKALNSYEESAGLYKQAGEPESAALVYNNMARTAVEQADYKQAVAWARIAEHFAAKLQNSHAKAFELMDAGRIYDRVCREDPAATNHLRLDSLNAFMAAKDVAQAINDQRALAYALGYIGHLYEEENKFDDALPLTRKALFLAQEVKSPEATFQWEWQTGRILAGRGQTDAAIEAYRRAVEILQSIRTDMNVRYTSSGGNSFRQAVGPVYFELADLLLRRTDSLKNEGEIQKCLLEARTTTELLKTAELEDYFHDDCVNLLKSRTAKIEATSPTAAIIYIIPLPDRTELLISLQSGMKRVSIPVPAAQLNSTAAEFRLNLENVMTEEYRDQGRQLYEWLVRPLKPILSANKIDTLVFVPDDALRTIPMAALLDKDTFLVEQYAIAVTPGLTLMESRPLAPQSTDMIVNGLSRAVPPFSALPYVPQEVNNLAKIYGAKYFLDENFTIPKVQKEFTDAQFSIVHIASHAQIDRDIRKTFVLTYDGKLTLDQLEQMIRPSQLRDKPVELLSLSACETAAGDDRAALGLAGIAVKAGARSAFATLWFVNDESSALLVSDFYSNLKDHPAESKAKALQKAQVEILKDPRYAHPCYWAPYLIIGNWL